MDSPFWVFKGGISVVQTTDKYGGLLKVSPMIDNLALLGKVENMYHNICKDYSDDKECVQIFKSEDVAYFLYERNTTHGGLEICGPVPAESISLILEELNRLRLALSFVPIVPGGGDGSKTQPLNVEIQTEAHRIDICILKSACGYSPSLLPKGEYNFKWTEYIKDADIYHLIGITYTTK